MADNRDYFVINENNDSIEISQDVITGVVSVALSEVEGIAGMSPNLSEQLSGKKKPLSVHAEEQDGKLTLDITIFARYGFSIPEVSAKAQKAVCSALSATTGFEVGTVNVHVNGVTFD